jgi:hypothetical protein
MILIDGEFRSADIVVGPWTTDQEIEKMVRVSIQSDVTFQGIADLRTACLESLAQSDAKYRSPFTTQ